MLLELGYAIANLGWERIILVYNKKFADKEWPNYSDIPFDISKHRLIGYEVNDKDDKSGKDELTKSLKDAVNIILQKQAVTNRDIIRDVHEGKRTKDVENLKWILKRVSLEAFDIFRDNLPEKMYMPVVEFFVNDIENCYSNSSFHIYNQELKKLIDDFCLSLKEVCGIGAYPTSEYNNGTGFYYMHGLRELWHSEMCGIFEKECSTFRLAYKQLIRYIRDYYSLEEVDVDKLSAEADNAFNDWLVRHRKNKEPDNTI